MKNDLRQKLHIEPRKGWLNDPNGLSFFKGEYRVYFQYSPDSAYGDGDKCWGCLHGRDLFHLTYEGTVILPDHPDDRNGVYSGCGLVKDDLLYLFYTGNVKEEGEHDYITSGRGANVMLVTTEDGIHMSEKRTLLRNSDYPDYCSCHVRDPKVWEEDGRYRMVLGARTLEDKGCVLFYTSDDLTDWRFEKADSVPDFGYMWECPDVIDVGGHRFLGISPQGLKHGEYTHQNVYSAGYFRYDDTLKEFEEWDYGFDFYAPQTFTAPDGRVILIGWMGIGDIPYTNPTTEMGWQHCLTLPRELTLRSDGGIIQRPIRELNGRKGIPAALKDGVPLMTQLPFYLASFAPNEGFSLDIGGMLELSFEGGIFSMRFTDSKAGGGRDIRRVKLGKFTGMEIIADMTSVEVFLNGGEKVMSTRFYPQDTELSITGHGIAGSVYTLKGMEVHYNG
ncbi:glycoside hydrolase family 32 protein [uncultured Ruminococcus sp.]|uniref:glycoside hydrolase family 32 protein n=1 Tax=uncultured Ruminococcus sp. TaxID=165186 RepID=UPI0025E34825|nr:glycoside hydrolase family 32 protein [uncultured Ruminococcus sp.]